MRNTLAIARRQFASYFNGPVAYVVACVTLLFVGFFFWQPFFLQERASVRGLYEWLTFTLILAAPAVTMGLIAEEKRSGTIEILLTMPVRDVEVILGKFLGALGLYAVILLLTLPYPLSVATLGELDWGQVAAGYFGMLLLGGATLSVGLVASSFTQNQIVALFVAVFVCFALILIDRLLPLFPVGVASILEWLSFNYHFESMARGVVDTRDVFFFVSVMVFLIALSLRALESRRWN